MGNVQFVDISSWQGANIDWPAYRAWAAQWDGIARVSLRSSYGTGYEDASYRAYRAGAEAAGVDVIIHYHYAYPQLNNIAANEANWQHQVVGKIRPNDVMMLDYEENTPLATAEWAYAWLAQQEQNYGCLPTIYASDAYIRARLQDTRLARYPLTLANWQYTPNERPACPPPWSHYTFLQYSDRATIPGIPGSVDANIYLGPSPTQGEDMIDLTDPWISKHFMQVATGPTRWQCSNGNDLFAGILDGWRKMNGAPRLPLGPEVKCGTQAVYKICEAGIVLWDPGKEIDGVDGPWAPCYLLKLDSPLAQKLLASTQPPQPTMPNVSDAAAQLETAATAIGTVSAAINKALSDLKQ